MIITRGSQWCGPQSIVLCDDLLDASGGDLEDPKEAKGPRQTRAFVIFFGAGFRPLWRGSAARSAAHRRFRCIQSRPLYRCGI